MVMYVHVCTSTRTCTCAYLNRCAWENKSVMSSQLLHCFGDLRVWKHDGMCMHMECKYGRMRMWLWNTTSVVEWEHDCGSSRKGMYTHTQLLYLGRSVLNNVALIQNAVVPGDWSVEIQNLNAHILTGSYTSEPLYSHTPILPYSHTQKAIYQKSQANTNTLTWYLPEEFDIIPYDVIGGNHQVVVRNQVL